jgi:spermidine synthase
MVFFSGFAALVYEILWTRHLALTFGANMLAVSIVAATFMGGLAIGSYLLGKVADKTNNPLRLYAIIEAGIAVCALAFPPALNLVNQVNIYLTQTFPESPAIAIGSKLLLSVGLLLLPTACMGGTLPVICRLFSDLEPGRMVGRLYAINTGGAVLGCLLASFLLIPKIGMMWTGTLAITTNLLVAMIAWNQAKTSEQTSPPISKPASAAPPSSHIILYTCVATIGALALGFEILWTRVFLLFLGSTTYAFATILGVYLFGLSLGAAIYARYLSRLRNQQRLFQLMLTAMGISILAALPFYDKLAYLFQYSHVFAEQQWHLLSTSSFLIVSLILLLPTALSGALFPTAVHLHSPNPDKVSSSIGNLLFWNTTGAVFGSLLVSLIAIPAVGILGSFRLLISLNLLLAIVVGWHFRKHLRQQLLLIPAAALLIVGFLPFSWDLQLMNSGVYYYSQDIDEAGGLSRRLEKHSPIIEQIEGLEATVALYRNAQGQRYFRVNGKTDGSSITDIETQMLLGQLPMLFQSDARDILVVGLGTGITLGQVAQYPGTNIDCAEISPAVVQISSHFAPENHNVLKKKNVRLLIEDARNLLQTSDKRYDIIVSQPSNPWQAGNANLFTKEFYQLAIRRLKKGGYFSQWLPIYDMPTDKLKTAINTILQSFPDTIAFGVGPDMILLSRIPTEELSSAPTLSNKYLAPANDLKRFAPDVGSLMKVYYYGDKTILSPFADGAPINTDNHPLLEFDRQMGQDRTRDNFFALMTNKDNVGSTDFPFIINKQ